MNKPKQVILVRKDLEMSAGKTASQVAHASIAVFLNMTHKLFDPSLSVVRREFEVMRNSAMDQWLDGDFTKIVLGVENEEEIRHLHRLAQVHGLPCSMIIDNGDTVFNGVETLTAVAIGPAYSDQIDPITSHLSLLK